METCYFEFMFDCGLSTNEIIPLYNKRIQNVILKSRTVYKDNKHLELQEKLDKDPNLTLYSHKNCISRYTSSEMISRFKRKAHQADLPMQPLKRTRSSKHETAFEFNLHCIFCGNLCNLEKDPKNPKRWKPAYLCKDIIKSNDQKLKVDKNNPNKLKRTFKQAILDI